MNMLVMKNKANNTVLYFIVLYCTVCCNVLCKIYALFYKHSMELHPVE